MLLRSRHFGRRPASDTARRQRPMKAKPKHRKGSLRSKRLATKPLIHDECNELLGSNTNVAETPENGLDCSGLFIGFQNTDETD